MKHVQPGREVVVTGLGFVTPLGIGIEENWDALMAGRSGIGAITRFDASSFPSQIAGEVRDFKASDFMRQRQVPRTDLFTQYTVAAARMALEDACLSVALQGVAEAAIVVGVSMGGIPTLEEQHNVLREHGIARCSPFTVPRSIPNLAAGFVAMEFGIHGPAFSVSTACASGATALEIGSRMIKAGEADVVLAGGSEAILCQIGFGSFCAMRALSTRNDEPARASRPFDKDRDGFVMSEGAAVLVLESREHSEKRDARIYAELVGYASNNDAYHFTSPQPDGQGAADCIGLALRRSGMEATEVDYINAHGTSTLENDRSETLAIKKALGTHAGKVAVSSTKSMTGHLLGAAGSVEAGYSILALVRGKIPPTINLDSPDPDCDLDYVPNQPREVDVRVALSNSFAFGGTNVTLVFRRWDH